VLHPESAWTLRTWAHHIERYRTLRPVMRRDQRRATGEVEAVAGHVLGRVVGARLLEEKDPNQVFAVGGGDPQGLSARRCGQAGAQGGHATVPGGPGAAGPAAARRPQTGYTPHDARTRSEDDPRRWEAGAKPARPTAANPVPDQSALVLGGPDGSAVAAGPEVMAYWWSRNSTWQPCWAGSSASST